MLRTACLAIAATFVVALTAACPPAKPAGEGEGEGEGAGGEGEGVAGEGEGVAGEGEGVAGEGEGEGAALGCQVDADCNGGTDQSCQTIFSGAGTRECFATCPTLTDACTTLAGGQGDCENFDSNKPHICVEQAADRAPCGDAANAACGDNTAGHEAVCVTLGDDPNTPQNEHDFSFCLVGCASNADCVIAGETCSQDIHFRIGTDPTLLGACAPTTAGNEACGLSATGAVLCTDAEKCTIPDGQNAGTCQ